MTIDAGTVNVVTNDNGTVTITMTVMQDSASLLKCHLGLDPFEGASQDDLGFEGPEDEEEYDQWWEAVERPIRTLHTKLVKLFR